MISQRKFEGLIGVALKKEYLPKKPQRRGPKGRWVRKPVTESVVLTPEEHHQGGFVYVDASYNWKDTVEGRGCGTVCLFPTWGKPSVYSFWIKVPGLVQLINRFELQAIRDAARKYPGVPILSDSRISVKWALGEGIGARWVPREANWAGLILESKKFRDMARNGTFKVDRFHKLMQYKAANPGKRLSEYLTTSKDHLY